MYSFLFIGNSYTYYNDMPAIFRGFAEAAGKAVFETPLIPTEYHTRSQWVTRLS